MRIAIAGKGGAGKTTISATLCRLLARQGRRVVAIDAAATRTWRSRSVSIADRRAS